MLWPPAWTSWLDWHWGGDWPNSWQRRENRHLHHHWTTEVTVTEQRELHDTAWLILKNHGAVADVSTYQLASELADALASMRDRQRS